jgi:hypothetical protein
MTFLDKLKTNIGGLIRLKTQLYWYDSNSWDGVEERVCLLLDVAAKCSLDVAASSPFSEGQLQARRRKAAGKVLLFIDDSPKWVLLSKEAVEFIQ